MDTILRGEEWLEILEDAYQTGEDVQVPNKVILLRNMLYRRGTEILRNPTTHGLHGGSLFESGTRSREPVNRQRRSRAPEEYKHDDSHRYDLPVHQERECVVPMDLDAVDMIDLFCNEHTVPANFSNSEGWRPDPRPLLPR